MTTLPRYWRRACRGWPRPAPASRPRTAGQSTGEGLDELQPEVGEERVEEPLLLGSEVPPRLLPEQREQVQHLARQGGVPGHRAGLGVRLHAHVDQCRGGEPEQDGGEVDALAALEHERLTLCALVGGHVIPRRFRRPGCRRRCPPWWSPPGRPCPRRREGT